MVLTYKPTPLPKEPDNFEAVMDAYRICLAHEAEDDKPIRARLLRCLLIHAPSQSGRELLAKEIRSCDVGTTAFHDLAELYIYHFVRVFKNPKGKTPTPSTHPSRRSFDIQVAMIGENLSAPIHPHQKAKHNALIRDGYRCMVTGRADKNSVIELEEKGSPLATELEDKPLAFTQCCHIFYRTINSGYNRADFDENSKSGKDTELANKWEVINLLLYTKKTIV